MSENTSPRIHMNPDERDKLRRSFLEISEPLPRAFELAREVLVFLPSGFDQRAENGSGSRVIVKRSLWMPLHSEDEVVWRGALDRFDDVVVGATGNDTEPVAYDIACGLMVTGVGGNNKRIAGRPNLRQPRSRVNRNFVRHGDRSSRLVINRGLDVLNEIT